VKRLLLFGLTAAVVFGACVGPSRTDRDYRRKVANTAEAVISAVESARLTADLATAGRAPAPYVALRLSESEESAAAVETGFAAVQPPNRELDDLRTETLDAVGAATEVLARLRIAAYRGELHELREIALELEGPVGRLRDLTKVATS
jgi:hypothetical protein